MTTTDASMMKNTICGYASPLGRPIVSGIVASTAAASPRGIITCVTFLSSLENFDVSTALATAVLRTSMATVAAMPRTMYSICPKLASSPTNTKKNALTRNASWLCVGSSRSIMRTLNRNTRDRLALLPSMSPNTSAVRAPDSPNTLAMKNRTNSMPRVSMYACCALPSFVVTYIHGMPTPRPRTSPTTTAVPIVSLSTAGLSPPVRTAWNMMNAIIVERMSVRADSKLSMDFADSDSRMFLTRPNTMAELLPPTIEPSRTLSSRGQPIQRWARAATAATLVTNPTSASPNAKCAVLAMDRRSRLLPPSNMIMIRATAAKYGTIAMTTSCEMMPRTGPITTPRIIRNATSGMPVRLKNDSPATPRKTTVPAASSTTGADAMPPPPSAADSDATAAMNSRSGPSTASAAPGPPGAAPAKSSSRKPSMPSGTGSTRGPVAPSR